LHQRESQSQAYSTILQKQRLQINQAAISMQRLWRGFRDRSRSDRLKRTTKERTLKLRAMEEQRLAAARASFDEAYLRERSQRARQMRMMQDKYDTEISPRDAVVKIRRWDYRIANIIRDRAASIVQKAFRYHLRAGVPHKHQAKTHARW